MTHGAMASPTAAAIARYPAASGCSPSPLSYRGASARPPIASRSSMTRSNVPLSSNQASIAATRRGTRAVGATVNAATEIPRARAMPAIPR